MREKLVGKGDMLYFPVGSSKPQRVQGCMITEEEIDRVVSFVKQSGEAHYSDEVMQKIEESLVEKDARGASQTAAEVAESTDPLFNDAVEVLLETGQASVSMLQRRLKLGYSRAARLIDQMEERGVVGPFEGSKPRQLLVSRASWEAYKTAAFLRRKRKSMGRWRTSLHRSTSRSRICLRVTETALRPGTRMYRKGQDDKMKTFVGYCNCPTEVFSLDGALSLFRALRGVYSERSEAGEGRCGADGGGRGVVRRYAPMVYRLALAQVRGRCDAEDIFRRFSCAASVVRLFFSEEEHRRAWLIRVTVNCAKNSGPQPGCAARCRWRKREGLFRETEDTLLWEQLQLLPGKYRAVLHLFYYEQLSVREIRKLLGEKPATVRTPADPGQAAAAKATEGGRMMQNQYCHMMDQTAPGEDLIQAALQQSTAARRCRRRKRPRLAAAVAAAVLAAVIMAMPVMAAVEPFREGSLCVFSCHGAVFYAGAARLCQQWNPHGGGCLFCS